MEQVGSNTSAVFLAGLSGFFAIRLAFSVQKMHDRLLPGGLIEILAPLVENQTNQEIADSLRLALSSVKWYAGEISGKLGVENRRHAVKMGVELGLFNRPGPVSHQPRIPAVPGFPSGIVTFLFAEMVSSTPLWEQMPEAMQVATAQHYAILRLSIEYNGG